MAGSLDSLFQRIAKDCKYKIMLQSRLISKRTEKNECTPHPNSNERLSCMKSKGVFPYSWAEGVEFYEYPKLISKEKFYNTLTQKDISEEQYSFAKHVWKTFQMTKMKDYLEMYCLTGNYMCFDILMRVYGRINNTEMHSLMLILIL